MRGLYVFEAKTATPNAFAKVEFRIGSKSLGTDGADPFRANWNTAQASDGTYALQAIGRNAAGGIVRSTEIIFRIDNHGDSLDVTSPDLSKPLHGLISLTINDMDRRYYPALTTVNIDGKDADDLWSDNTGKHGVALKGKIDTTEYANGTHELYIGMHSDMWPKDKRSQKSWHNWRGGFERVVNFQNEHSLMDIEANYLHVYLQPGHETKLSCREIFTDETSTPCRSPEYKSSAPDKVAVSAEGLLRAGSKEGFATITIADRRKSTQVYVWVRNDLNVPHFAGSGQILNAYKPGSSLFVVAPFVLQVADLRHNPQLLTAVRAAGINTLSQGFYVNPRNLITSYTSWRNSYDANIAPSWEFAKRNHLHVLATGDEVCRNIGGEAWWTLNWPFGEKAVQYAFESLAASDVAVAVDMVDEASMPWGPTPKPLGLIGRLHSFDTVSCVSGRCAVSWRNNPVNASRFPSGTSFALAGSRNPGLNTPAGRMFKAYDISADSFRFSDHKAPDGTFTSANDPNLTFVWWAGKIGGCPTEPCDPPVPNDALVRITRWLHSSRPRVPISWPVLGASSANVAANWMGPSGISDYASEYWISFKLRPTYTWSNSVQELGYWMTHTFYDRQPELMLDRPQLMLISVSGPAYIKESPGPYYNPPKDRLGAPGVSAADINSSMMTAAALGVAGERLYLFENPKDETARAAAKSGTYFQTGVSPTAKSPIVRKNWKAMSYAATMLTQVLAPYLLGTELNSPAYGPNIVTAARQAQHGRMLMIVNDNDWERTISVDLAPYEYRDSVVRYFIGSDGVKRAALRTRQQQTITLAAGETVVYLFGAGG